ncbi:MAG: hypothetical protein R3B07_12990 [Polyangiaceae bacterium]
MWVIAAIATPGCGETDRNGGQAGTGAPGGSGGVGGAGGSSGAGANTAGRGAGTGAAGGSAGTAGTAGTGALPGSPGLVRCGFAGAPSCDPIQLSPEGVCCEGGWCVTSPGMALALKDVYAAPATDVRAGGGWFGGLMHFDGAAWRGVVCDFALNGISGSSGSDVGPDAIYEFRPWSVP